MKKGINGKSMIRGARAVLGRSTVMLFSIGVMLPLVGCLGSRIGNQDISGSLSRSQRREIQALDLETISKIPSSKLPSRDDLLLNQNERTGSEVTPSDDETVLQKTEEQLRRRLNTKSEIDYLQLPSLKPAKRESFALELDQARAVGLKNNLNLMARLIDPAISMRSIGIEKARFDATFSTAITWADNFKSGKLGGFYDVQPGVSQILPGGTSVTVGGQGLSTSFSGGDSELRAYSSGVNASVSQPVLKGFGPRITSAPIHIARMRNQISEVQTKLSVIRLLGDIEVAYWEVEAARQLLAIQEQQLGVGEQQLEIVEKLIDTGFVTRVERNRALSGLLARRENVVVARTTLRLRERELKRLLNLEDLPLDGATEIICATIWEPIQIKLDPGQLVSIAMSNRMELAAIQLELIVNDINEKLAKNNKLPALDLQLAYRREGQALNRSDSLDFAFNERRSVDDYTVGAVVSYPIGNRRARETYEQVKLERLRVLASERDQKQQIQKEILDTVDQLERDWERIIAARSASRASELTYTAEVDQFVRGLRTSTEVLEAASNWALAQTREIRAMADYSISKVFVALATGTMLGYSNVEWEPFESE